MSMDNDADENYTKNPKSDKDSDTPVSVDITQVVKLTNWANEPTIQDLQNDFTQAASARSDQMALINKWRLNYKAQPKPVNKEQQGSTIQPKLIRKQAEWRAPAVSETFLTSPDLFTLEPVSQEDQPLAEQTQTILNNQFNTKIDKVACIDQLVRALIQEGTVVVRVGWEFKQKSIKTTVPTWAYKQAPESAQQLQQYIQLQQTQPDAYSQLNPMIRESVRVSQLNNLPIMATPIGTEEQTKKVTISNKPLVDICVIDNFYIDPTCEGDASKAQFMIYSFETSMSELNDDGRYKNLDMIEAANGTPQPTDPDHKYTTGETNFTFRDKPRQKMTAYEYHGYYDIDGSGIVEPILATWIGSTLIRMEKNPMPDGKPPFIIIPYIPQKRSVYGVPDGELLEDNQRILGAVTRGVIDILGKSANSQTGIAKGVLDPTNRIRFRKGLDYEYNPNTNPQTQIFMHKFPDIPNSAMNMIALQNNDAEALSGVRAFSSAGMGGDGLNNTAAGVRSVTDAASKREMSVLRRIASGLLQVGHKVISLNNIFLTEDEVTRITNSPYIPPRTDDYCDENDLRLEISTVEADAEKAKELSFMLQTMGNTMGQGFAQIVMAKIARLQRMPDLAASILAYQPQPDPLAQQKAQLEIQLLQSQIALTNAQAQEAGTKGQVNQAKVGTEQARTNSVQGDADLKSQTFVQKATGQEHQNSLEKQQLANQGALDLQNAKANANIQSQVVGAGIASTAAKDKHNSQLLQLHAQQSLTPPTNSGGQLD